MLFISLAVITFGLAQTLPIVDEAIETPSTSEGPGGPDGGRVVFDQRQTGKYNIHVSIKDVAIIEVGQNGLAEESYNDEEDYYYDDSALTVKPIKLSTEASTSSTTSSSTTTTSSTTAGAPPAEITSPTTISSKPKSRLNNLMIVETPIGGATVKPLHHPASPLHARSKDVPIMAAAAAANTPPSLPESIEYTPPQGHNSPIFKVKVQRSSNPATKKPARCRNHQVRDAQGKCSDSIYRKLFGMLKGLNFPFLAANAAESA